MWPAPLPHSPLPCRYVLYTAVNYVCPALWDPNNPTDSTYGYYENYLCHPIPPDNFA